MADYVRQVLEQISMVNIVEIWKKIHLLKFFFHNTVQKILAFSSLLANFIANGEIWKKKTTY